MLDTFLLYLPAFLANAAPVVWMRVPWVRAHNAPICPALFGGNKTWQGLIGGIVVGALCGGVLGMVGVGGVLYARPIAAAGYGALLGFGALTGDAMKSAVKRRMGIPPGGRLPVLDNVDYGIGALLVLLPFHVPTVHAVVLVLFLAWFLSIVSNLTAYALGLKAVWY